MEKRRNAPKIRFDGFFDDWEQRKLGELADIIGGGTPSTTNEEYWDGDIDWYSPVEIGKQLYVDCSQKKLTELGLLKSSAKILPIGTVLFTSRAGIGNTAILAKEGATNQGFQSIVPHKKKLDSYFIYSRTHELKRYGEKNGAGSTFVEVSGKQMSKMSILIPDLEEQEKIGQFFAQLDNTIALHQEQLCKLSLMKEGFLQLMFPQNADKEPRLRFANFFSVWEQRRLGDLMIFSNGVNAMKENYGHGTKMISVMDVLSDGRLTHDKIRNSVSLSTRSEDSNKVENGDLVFVRSSETPVEAGWAKAYLSKEPVVFSGFTIRGKKVANFNALFIELFLNSKGRRQLDRKASGSTHFNIGQAQLNSTVAIMPSLLEQECIASLFENLENTISLHHERIDKLKDLKNAYLKMMFI